MRIAPLIHGLQFDIFCTEICGNIRVYFNLLFLMISGQLNKLNRPQHHYYPLIFITETCSVKNMRERENSFNLKTRRNVFLCFWKILTSWNSDLRIIEKIKCIFCWNHQFSRSHIWFSDIMTLMENLSGPNPEFSHFRLRRPHRS